MDTSLPDTFLNEHQVADHLKISVATLQRWRWANKGPAYFKMGRSVRYEERDLQIFVEQGRVETAVRGQL